MSRGSLVVLASLLVAGAAAAAPPRGDLTSTAERSGWRRTGRHAEAVRLCHGFARAFPGRARCDRFGVSPEGRELVALIVGRQQPGGPTLLFQAGIHAGEIEGKDAGFWFLRGLLDGKVVPGALDHLTIVFVPILNVDGHERFGPNQRPNQRGPEEGGYRTTAGNLNLNRDYLKVDSPEIAALLALWQRWDPAVFVDLHTTDGAKFQHDVSVMVQPRIGQAARLVSAARALSDGLQRRLTDLGHLPLDFYPSLEVDDDPTSGFASRDAPPRFSQAYAAARNRIGILVETHSWRTYPERVVATYHVLQALVERARGAGWQAAGQVADREAAALAGREVPLSFRATEVARTIDFRGYRYRRVPSEVSGGLWTIYDERAPEIWRIPLRDQQAADVVARAPRAGYLVSAGFAAAVAPRLRAHGIRFRRVEREVAVDAEVYRVTAVEYAPPYEGRTRPKLTGRWTRERRAVAPGALFVPIAQPRARLAVHLFEPAAPDSLAGWGFFNATLEQKEYLEAYVAEEVARQLLRDPAVRADFDRALKDPAFAGSRERRLDFFYRRHPSWDERRDLLPVFRLDAAPR